MARPPAKSPGLAIGISWTIAAPAARIFIALADEELRRIWLPDGRLDVTRSQRPSALRGRWDSGPGRVAISLLPAGTGETQVALEHERLPDAATAERMTAFWTERLERLREMVEG